VEGLSTSDVDVVGLPLIETGAPADVESLHRLHQWQSKWHTLNAIMVVSPAAARQFLAPPGFCATTSEKSAATRWWSPGPGSARVLRRLLTDYGLDADAVDSPPSEAANFDSEALWSVVKHQLHPGFHLLVVRGRTRKSGSNPIDDAFAQQGEGREWLMDHCRAAGAQVDICVAYERFAPDWPKDQVSRVETFAPRQHVWMFSSSEGVAELARRMPDGAWRSSTALATHPRIAEAAREAGFQAVLCCKPILADVVRTLELHRSQFS